MVWDDRLGIVIKWGKYLLMGKYELKITWEYVM